MHQNRREEKLRIIQALGPLPNILLRKEVHLHYYHGIAHHMVHS